MKIVSRRPLARIALAAALSIAPAQFFDRAAALDRGQAAPEIGLTDLHGKPVELASLRGKVVLVDFWASWCAPCRESLPFLEKLAHKYRGEGLVVVGVNIDKTRELARAFLDKHRLALSFPVVHDGKHEVAGRYKPPTMPSSYIVDRKGVVRGVHAGFRSSDATKLEAELQSLLR